MPACLHARLYRLWQTMVNILPPSPPSIGYCMKKKCRTTGGGARNRANTASPHRIVQQHQIRYGPWDITYLAGAVKGLFYYLYLIIDIFSRDIVGWEVWEEESAEPCKRTDQTRLHCPEAADNHAAGAAFR